MRLRTSKGKQGEELPVRNYNLAITGEAVDDRGIAAQKWCASRAKRCVTLSYSPEAVRFAINNQWITLDSLSDFLNEVSGPIVLEATTLGFVEIAHCCRALFQQQLGGVQILYVEPLKYAIPHSPDKILLNRDFSLTDVVRPFSGVPGWIRRLTPDRPQNIVFFLGFEGERLAQAIEQLILSPEYCTVTFGLPAFRPGWEMNAFANNITSITESKLRGGVRFCGADNPAAVVKLLNELATNFGASHDLFALPIGTKPHAIGLALYAATEPKIGIIYDFPQRRKRRSESERTWHLFEATFE